MQPARCSLDGIFFGEYFTGLRMITQARTHERQSVQPAVARALALMKSAGARPTVQTLDSLVSTVKSAHGYFPHVYIEALTSDL